MKPFKLNVLTSNEQTEQQENLGIDLGAIPDEHEMTFFEIQAVYPCPNNSEYCRTHILAGGQEFTCGLGYSKVIDIIKKAQYE